MAANSLPLDFGYLADTKFIFDQDKVHTFPLLKRTIICFYPSETIVMFGSVSCRVLKGTLTCYGSNIFANKDFFQLHAPTFGPSLTLSPQPKHASEIVDFDTIQDIDTQVKHAALDACINENFALVLELAPSPSGVECDTRGLLSEWDILHIPGFAVVFSVAAPKSIHVNKPLTVCHLWESAADELIDSLATRNTRNIVPCLQVVGARGVGKSTFCRYLVNRLLSRVGAQFEPVAFLDTDLGQPEMGFPGTVGLYIVTHPLLGPPHTHLRTPHKMYWIGSVEASIAPHYYMDAIQQLLEEYKSTFSQLPLVINTHGWMQGMGYEMVTAIAMYAHVTHVAHIQGDSPTKCSSFELNDLNGLDPIIRVLTSHSSKGTRTAAYHRSERINSYFCKHKQNMFLQQSTPAYLASTPPYMVPWFAIRLCVMHNEVPPYQTLYAINGGLVGLGVDETVDILEDKSKGGLHSVARSLPRFLRDPPLIPCIGIGLVRSIDPEKKLFYIITPEPSERLAQVNTLLKGNIEMPAQLIYQATSRAPYFSANTIFDSGIKSRVNLKRDLNKKQ